MVWVAVIIYCNFFTRVLKDSPEILTNHTLAILEKTALLDTGFYQA